MEQRGDSSREVERDERRTKPIDTSTASCTLGAEREWCRTSIPKPMSRSVDAGYPPPEVALEEESEVAWHALPDVGEVCKQLGVSTDGLSTKEASDRLAKYGPNRLTPAKKETFLRKLFRHTNSILIYILIVAAALSLYFATTKSGEESVDLWAEFGLIVAVIVINVTIGLIQEGNAEKSAEAIKAMLSSKAVVLRDGERMTLDAELLVPGDVVYLRSGDRVPADVRFIEVNKLQVQESLLTGESNPVKKTTEAVEATTGIADRKCLAYSATLVTTGEASAIVVATGDDAEIGRISKLVGSVTETKTNLLVQMDIIGMWISLFVFIIATATFFLGMFGPYKRVWEAEEKTVWQEAFKNAIAVSVAIIPEGLPAVVTITLALGVTTMAKNNAIIRKLPCVETLGSLTVICSDKTGTLTKNEMTVVSIRTATSEVSVTGVGYEPVGNFLCHGKPLSASQHQFVAKLLEIGALCNNSNLIKRIDDKTKKVHWDAAGSPTEVAIIVAATKAGLNAKQLLSERPRIGGIPFESEHKFMASVHSGPGSKRQMLVKGAADRMIELCKSQFNGDSMDTTGPIDKKFWHTAASQLGSRGLRVLALCLWDVPEDEDISEIEASYVLTKGEFLTIAGLVAILDPPREECISAIRDAQQAGITVKMITGDHADTALAIGKMLGIADDECNLVYTGPQLDSMSRDELHAAVLECNVFARASPENKIQIVQGLQVNHEITSMTGDGVNDAPALKAANIGVAMGITGTDVTKEVAQMVLADDNFSTIISAVKEGRRVWDNLRKILIFNLPVNLAQGLTVFFAMSLEGLGAIPLTAIQVLYINMITSVTMGMMLAAEPSEADIMMKPPRLPNKRLLGKYVVWRCVIVSSLMIIAIIGVFEWNKTWPSAYSVDRRRAEAFTVLIFMEVAYSFNCRFLKSSSINTQIITGNVWAYASVAVVTLLQVFILYTPGVQRIFHVEGLDAFQWVRVLLISTCLFLAVELLKTVIDPVIFKRIKADLRLLNFSTPRFLDRKSVDPHRCTSHYAEKDLSRA